jgi:hypothetical protein
LLVEASPGKVSETPLQSINWVEVGVPVIPDTRKAIGRRIAV